MSVPGLGVLVLIAAQAEAIAPVQRAEPRRVFLEGRTRADGKKDCVDAVAYALRNAIAKTPRLALARSAVETDVTVKVAKCTTETTAASARELELSRSTGSRRGGGVRLNSGTEVTTEAKVTLGAAWDGETREFTSGPTLLPIQDAARLAAEDLLGWVESVPDEATP